MAIYQARFNRYLRGPRPQGHQPTQQGLGLPRRRRDRRAGVAGRHHAGLAREARQPDLRHQLQPAAARRPGARQRQDHPGAGGRLPRRRLERHQGHLGQRLGPAAGSATRAACSSSAWARSSTASIRSTSSSRRLHPRALLRQVPRAARAGRAPLRRAAHEAARAAGTTRTRSTPPTRPPSRHKGTPTVILAKTIKGYGLGEAGEGTQHHAPAEEAERGRAARVPHPLRHSRSPTRTSPDAPFYKPADDSPEMKYLHERRKALGGYVPQRACTCRAAASADAGRASRSSCKGSGGTRALDDDGLRATCSTKLLQRQGASASTSCRSSPTRPAPSAWRRCSASTASTPRRPALRAGRSRHAAATTARRRTARSSRRASPRPARCRRSSPPARPTPRTACTTIPFFIYYSMFGFQRIGDLIWAAADMRVPRLPARRAPPAARRSTARACSTRTATATCWPRPCPTCLAYDPAFAYELAVIIQDGIRRMYEDAGRRLLLHHAVQRATTRCRRCPRAREEGILKGHVQAQAAPPSRRPSCARSSSAAAPILNEALRGAGDPGGEVRRRRRRLERDQLQGAAPRGRPRLRALEPAAPDRAAARAATSTQVTADEPGVFVAASDYMKALPEMIDRWVPGGLFTPGHRRLRPQRDPGGAAATSSRSTPSASPWRRSTR